MDTVEFMTAVATKAYFLGLVSCIGGALTSIFNEDMGCSILSFGMVFGLFALAWSVCLYVC